MGFLIPHFHCHPALEDLPTGADSDLQTSGLLVTFDKVKLQTIPTDIEFEFDQEELYGPVASSLLRVDTASLLNIQKWPLLQESRQGLQGATT